MLLQVTVITASRWCSDGELSKRRSRSTRRQLQAQSFETRRRRSRPLADPRGRCGVRRCSERAVLSAMPRKSTYLRLRKLPHKQRRECRNGDARSRATERSWTRWRPLRPRWHVQHSAVRALRTRCMRLPKRRSPVPRTRHRSSLVGGVPHSRRTARSVVPTQAHARAQSSGAARQSVRPSRNQWQLAEGSELLVAMLVDERAKGPLNKRCQTLLGEPELPHKRIA